MLKKFFILLCLTLSILMLVPSLADDDIVNILLIGTDDLDNQVTAEQKLGRADAIYVLNINKTKSEVKLLGVERDYLVNLGDNGGQNKLATSTYFGGIDSCIEHVNSILGLDLNLYVQIDIQGVAKSIDFFGGIDIDLNSEEISLMNALLESDYPDLSFPPLNIGQNKLNGIQSHAYLQIRDLEKEAIASNIERNDRHKKLFSKLLEKAKSFNPSETIKILEQVMPLIDTNVSLADIFDISETLQAIRVENVFFSRSPFTAYQRVRKGVHQVITLEDPVAEKNAVNNFLYGE